MLSNFSFVGTHESEIVYTSSSSSGLVSFVLLLPFAINYYSSTNEELLNENAF